jgi:putative sterol carrier protein
MKFGSLEYMEAFRRAMVGDTVYRELAKGESGSYTFVIEPDPSRGAAERCVMGYREDNGEVTEVWEGERPTEFKLAGPYRVWVDILRGELGPIRAMTMRKLKISGDLVKLVTSSTKATLRMVEVLRSLPTEFDGEFSTWNLPGA